jgi:hypothetical protein
MICEGTYINIKEPNISSGNNTDIPANITVYEGKMYNASGRFSKRKAWRTVMPFFLGYQLGVTL